MTKFALCLIKHHTMKAYGEKEARLDTFITSVLDVSGQLNAPTTLPAG
jgi:hypothetical protein